MALMVAARLIVPLQVSGYDNVIDTPGLARRLACASCAHNQESRKSYLRGSGRERARVREDVEDDDFQCSTCSNLKAPFLCFQVEFKWQRVQIELLIPRDLLNLPCMKCIALPNQKILSSFRPLVRSILKQGEAVRLCERLFYLKGRNIIPHKLGAKTKNPHNHLIVWKPSFSYDQKELHMRRLGNILKSHSSC